jgi:hypothetical protein
MISSPGSHFPHVVTDTSVTEEPQGVLKAVAADSIDDCVTVDFSRQNLDKRRRASVSAKNPATSTLTATLARSKTEPKPAIETSPAPTPTHTYALDSHLKFGLPTPVKRAIQSKRKSISFDLEKLQEIQTPAFAPCEISAAEVTTTTPSAPVSVSAVETALNRVIQQHQKKLLEELRTVEEDPSPASSTITSMPSASLQTPHNTTNREAAEYSVLKTPLKRDIHARRITRSAVKVLETFDSPLGDAPSATAALPPQPSDLAAALMTPPPVRGSGRKTRQSVTREPVEVILQPSPAAEPVPVPERRVTRQSLKTPLKNAIQSRRKSLVTAVETLDKVLDDDPIVEPERSTLKTPLKKAIQARRKSYAAQVEALDQLALNEEEQAEEEEKEEISSPGAQGLPSPSVLVLSASDQPSPAKEIPRALRSPLKKAIEMRRKSLESEVAAIDKLGESEQPVESSPSTPAPRSIRKSLQRAIHSRRKSLTTEIERLSEMEKKMETAASDESAAVEQALATELDLLPPPSLPAPLLAAIESRRYNLKSEVKILEEISFLAAAAQEEEQEEESLNLMDAPSASGSPMAQAPSTPSAAQQVLKTPIRKAIQSRRKSSTRKRMSNSSGRGSLVESFPGARSLQTPLRLAIQSRRKSLLAEIGHLDDSFSCAAASIGADMSSTEADLCDMSLMGVEYEANQLCSRLSIASFASSIGRFEGQEDGDEVLAEALECFLDQPEAFYSPRRCSFSSSRRFQGEKLLSSMEKKGAEAVIGPMSAEMVADIMAAITDEELGMVDDYAKQLVAVTGMEDEEAYARCLDAFIQGVEAATRLNRAPSPVASPAASTSATPVVTTSDSAVATASPQQQPEQTTVAVISAESQIDFLEQKKLDLQLIIAYADDLEYSASLRPEIAYGIALDTYLADPISFRSNVRAMKTDPCTPIEWVEYEGDGGWEQDYGGYGEAAAEEYDGETENECEDLMPKSNAIPLKSLPSPISEEKEEQEAEEESDRLIAGHSSPMIEKERAAPVRGRGRAAKKIVPISIPAALDETPAAAPTAAPAAVTPSPAAGKKRGRPSAVKAKEPEEKSEVKGEEEQEEIEEAVESKKSRAAEVTPAKATEAEAEAETAAVAPSTRRGKRKAAAPAAEEEEESALSPERKPAAAKPKSSAKKTPAKGTTKGKAATPAKKTPAKKTAPVKKKAVAHEEEEEEDMEEATAILCDG